MDEITENARQLIAENIAAIREHNMAHEIGDRIYELGYQSAIAQGARDSQAGIIAGYLRTQF